MSTSALAEPVSASYPQLIAAIRAAKITVIGQDDIKNEAQAEVATAVIRAFGDSPAGFIYCEPCTARSTRRPPDVVLCHPQFGLVVFEVKGYSISSIESVTAGSLFVRHQGIVRPINAFRQAEQAMFDIKHQVERNSGGKDLPLFNAVVALPNIKQREWESKGFATSFPDAVLLLKEDLSTEALNKKLNSLVAPHRRALTPEQIDMVQRVFGDSATINDIVNCGPRLRRRRSAHLSTRWPSWTSICPLNRPTSRDSR